VIYLPKVNEEDEMKKTLVIWAVVLGLPLMYVSLAHAGEASGIKAGAELAPVVLEYTPAKTGSTAVLNLLEVRWPKFVVKSASAASASCVAYLGSISEKLINPNAAPQWFDAMDTGDIVIDQRYRAKGKIMITWNFRLLAQPTAISLPSFCTSKGYPFSGDVQLIFKEGKAFSRVLDIADGSQRVLREVVMTVPEGGKEIVDPTTTGSIIITPQMYGGQLPAKIRLKLQWRNDSSLQLESRSYDWQNMRNIIVTITRD
jgi:hypothetical protein